MKGTGDDSDDPGLLAFVYEEKTADGKISYFNKLVSRDSVREQLEEQSKQASSSRKKSSSGKEHQPSGHH